MIVKGSQWCGWNSNPPGPNQNTIKMNSWWIYKSMTLYLLWMTWYLIIHIYICRAFVTHWLDSYIFHLWKFHLRIIFCLKSKFWLKCKSTVLTIWWFPSSKLNFTVLTCSNLLLPCMMRPYVSRYVSEKTIWTRERIVTKYESLSK